MRERVAASAGGRRLASTLFVFVRGSAGELVCDPARPVGLGARVPAGGDGSRVRVPPDGDRSCPVAAGKVLLLRDAVAPDELRVSASRGTPDDCVIVRGPDGPGESCGVRLRLIAGSPGVGVLVRPSGRPGVGARARTGSGSGTRPVAGSTPNVVGTEYGAWLGDGTECGGLLDDRFGDGTA